jgi:GMP synthase-like glutamine amidotransferase
MQIGILETGRPTKDLAERHGAFPQMFSAYLGAATGAKFAIHSIFEGAALPDVHASDAWIITGSPHGVYEDHVWLQPAMQFVRDALAAKRRTLGICFGHQLMAQAMGGHVEKSSKGWATGIHQYTLTEEGKKRIPLPQSLSLLAIHQDQVVKQPPSSTLLASSAFCDFAAFGYGEHGLSFQGHPEFTLDYERDLINQRKQNGRIPHAVADKGLATLESLKADSHHLLPALRKFLTGQ